MKNFKFKFTLLLIITICLSSLILFSSCDNQPEDIKLYIKNTEAPRATYVQGQELDLTSGSLTYSVDGEETTLAFNAEGVTVSGYDKNMLGQQTLTVTYNEKTVNVNVTVIPRISAESFETKYFVGDEFNKTKGRLKIAKDDATTFTVNVNSDKVSIVSFDSSKAGESTVTLKYKDGEMEYECDLQVNVYAIASVTLTKPTKTKYATHEEGIDFSGGYLTVKSTSDGNLEKFVELTADMISGFDLTAANEADHKDTPLEQTITISYGGQTFTYKITITYSGISIIKDRLEIFSSIDWDDDDEEVTPEQGQAAIDAIKAYYALKTNAEKKLISKSELDTIVRTAAFWGTLMYREELKNHENIIKINGNQIVLTGSSYANVKPALEKFSNKDEKLNVYAELLRDILDDYPDVVIRKDVTVEKYVFVLSKELHNEIIGIYEHFVDLYALLSDVPQNWNDSDLIANKDKILKAVTDIASSNYSLAYGSFYNDILSKWRTKDDYLDILYYYYLYIEEDVDYINESMFERVPLPKALDNWYQDFVSALNASANLVYDSANRREKDNYLADVSPFMFFYHKTLDDAEGLKNHTNTFYRDLYEAIDGDYLIEATIHAYSFNLPISSTKSIKCYGYLYHCAEMLESDAFMNLWDKYLVLIKIYANDTLEFEEHDAKFKDMIAAFSALTPAELHGFLTSLNFKYDTSRGSVLVTEYGDGPMSTFIDFMQQYFKHVLSEDEYAIFPKLLRAMEICSQFDINNQYISDFTNAMADVIELYNDLSIDEQNHFNTYLGTLYTKYLTIYNTIKGTYTPSTGDYDAKFNELKVVIEMFNKVKESIEDPGEGEDNSGLLGLLIALYERANTLYGELYELDKNTDAYTALFAKTYAFGNENVSLDTAFFRVRTVMIAEIMLTSQYTSTDKDGVAKVYNAWDFYSKSTARKFFESCAYTMYYTYDNTYSAPTKEAILALMESFRALYDDTDAMNVFCAFDGDSYLYKTIRAFFEDALSEDAYTVADNLLLAEVAYISYVLSEDDSYLDTFREKFEAANADYSTKVSEDEKTLTDALYNYYKAIYDELPEPEPAE